MIVSEIRVEDAAEYMKLEEDQYQRELLEAVLEAAKDYVSGYVGLPISSDTGDSLDQHKDISLAVLALVQDMYDNRSMQVDKNNVNKTVESILNMHRRNLL